MVNCQTTAARGGERGKKNHYKGKDEQEELRTTAGAIWRNKKAARPVSIGSDHD